MGAVDTGPTALDVRREGIPAELKGLPRWVVWRWTYTAEKDKWTKPPYIAATGAKASSTNPETWATGPDAWVAYQAGGWSGIGFVLTDDDDLAGIDLDHCVTDGIVEEWALSIVRRIASYAELSPSGTGVRIIVRGQLPPGGRKRGDVEVYESGRYLTLTGHRLPEAPATIEQRQDELEAFHAEHFPAPTPAPRPQAAPSMANADLLARAFAARNGAKVEALYGGDDSLHGGDTSAADLALCSALAFWTQDPDQLDDIIRTSPRHRPKWDAPHAADGRTYGRITVDKALTGVTETFTPALPAPALVTLHRPADGAVPHPDEDGQPRRSTWWPVDPDRYLGDGAEGDPPPTLLTRTDGQPLLYPATVNGIYGESESMKSWLAQYAIAQVVDGGHLAVYLDFEATAGQLYTRLQGLGCKPDGLRTHFRYIQPDAPLDDHGGRDMAEVLATLPALVVLDGITDAMTLHGLNPLDNVDWSVFKRRILQPLTATGAAVVFIDHVKRDSQTRGKGPIGAQHKRSSIHGAGYMIEAIRPFGRGCTGLAKISIDKDRPGYVRGAGDANRAGVLRLIADQAGEHITATIEPPDGTSTAGTFRPTVLMQRTSEMLEGATEPLSVTKVQERVSGQKEAVATALKVLVAEDYVSVEDGPRNSQLHTSVKPYRESMDRQDPPPHHRPPTDPDRPPGGGQGRVQDDRTTAPHPPTQGGGGGGGRSDTPDDRPRSDRPPKATLKMRDHPQPCTACHGQTRFVDADGRGWCMTDCTPKAAA